MTALRRGRGRPVTFDTTARQRYLDLVASGTKLSDAAAAVDITARWPNTLAAQEPAFRDALAIAKAKGRAVRAEAMPHGESRYKHAKCRCPICTKAASAARAARPDRQPATSPEPAPQPTELTAVPNPPAESLSSFPLARPLQLARQPQVA